jgi:opacity protein-like surface antigen
MRKCTRKRNLLRDLALAAWATAVALPCGHTRATGLEGLLSPPGAADAADDAWSQAGLCVSQSPVAPAGLSYDSYPVDRCGCEHASGCEIECNPVCHSDCHPDQDACGTEAGLDEPAAGCCGGLGDDRPARRFYITGIIGASFGTLQSGGVNTEGNFPNTGRASDSLLTAGGALGTAFDRSNGLLRLEVEGRGRDALSGRTNSFEPPTPSFFYSVRASDGWSVMANAWRDWSLTERLGFYGGGGIGAGGYRLNVNDSVVSGYGHVGGFAWQAGTGTTFQITDRTTIDLGYRFFDTVSDGLPLSVSGFGGRPAGSYLSNFYASELLLSVRIYEPFRSRPVH